MDNEGILQRILWTSFDNLDEMDQLLKRHNCQSPPPKTIRVVLYFVTKSFLDMTMEMSGLGGFASELYSAFQEEPFC